MKIVRKEKGSIQEKIEATRKGCQEGTKTRINALMDAHLEQINSFNEKKTVGLETTKACLGKTEVRMQTLQEETEAEIMPELEAMNVTESEVTQENVEEVAEHQQVLTKRPQVEINGAPEDRYGDQQPQ
jgi:citrate lyase beta subunit